MSSITTTNGILHYEVYGRGRPVIFLHGWLGSVQLWQETMLYLGQYYRTYSLDFWGFGESGQKLNTYAVKDFVGMVDQFMEQLGIVSAPLVGHSMGGTVSLAVATTFPERVQKVTVIGSPIKGSSLAPLLKLAGFRLPAWFIFKFYGVFRWLMRYLYSPLISRDTRFPKMMDSDLTRLSLQSFMTSIATLRKTDLRPQLDKVKVPVMGMYGDRDIIVSPHEWKTLLGDVPTARIERFPKAGHFIMLDDPQRFREVMRDFLDKKV